MERLITPLRLSCHHPLLHSHHSFSPSPHHPLLSSDGSPATASSPDPYQERCVAGLTYSGIDLLAVILGPSSPLVRQCGVGRSGFATVFGPRGPVFGGVAGGDIDTSQTYRLFQTLLLLFGLQATWWRDLPLGRAGKPPGWGPPPLVPYLGSYFYPRQRNPRTKVVLPILDAESPPPPVLLQES